MLSTMPAQHPSSLNASVSSNLYPSLDNLPNEQLNPLDLSSHQLAQLLTNYRSCLAQIFANGYNYHSILPIHKSPVTWCSSFYGALVHTTRLLMVLEVIAAWEAHHCTNPSQGLHITAGFIHHLGLLLCLFEDWLDITKQDMEYCQAFIAYDSTNVLGQWSKSGHILVVNTSTQTSNLQSEVLLLGHGSPEDVHPTIDTQHGLLV